MNTTTATAPVRTGGFAGALNRAVTERLDPETLRAAHRRLHVKAVIIAAWFLASFAGVILATGWAEGVVAAASFALAFAAVGFNIQHDANRWRYRHNTLHHGSPNVVGVDSDINLGPLARLAPFQPRRPWHRFQHLYLWPLYSFTVLEIMFNDLATLVGASRHSRGHRTTVSDATVAVTTKVAFVAFMVGLPTLTHPFWVVVVGALAVILTVGLVLGVVFQSAHIVEGAEFAQGGTRPPYQWHEWQVRSSFDFSHGSGPLSRLFRWYAGGLDHQTEHHLFPRLPHTAYPLIAPIVTEVCADYGVPRRVQPSFHAALASHYRHLRAMGARPPAH